MKSASAVPVFLHQALVFLVLTLMLTLLSACGSEVRDTVASKTNGTMGDAADAALTSLEDVGVKRDEIPEKLKALVNNPYSTPKPLKCKIVQAELADLDGLLGPDLDAPKVALSAGASYAEAGAELIHDGIVGIVRSQTSFIPFRSIVRSLTGAKKHEKALAKAKEAGKLRRAYLKGLASAKFGDSCPIGPVVVTAENEKDDTKKPMDSNLEVAAK